MKAQATPEITLRPVEQLVPYARNARTHSDEQIAQIAASIREFGWTNPVLLDGNSGIIAGHARLQAARKLGLKQVPCLELAHLTEAQKRAYILADNRLALNAGWDLSLLAGEIQELKAEDFDLNLLGFDDKELSELLAYEEGTQGLTDPDEVPEAPVEPVTQPGDLWLLGKHRLLCGDATKREDVERCLGGVQPHLMVTDPPYGVDFDPTWRKGSEKRTYMGDKPDREAGWADVWALFPGDVAYVWHASGHIPEVWAALRQAGFELRQLIIWNKSRFIIGRGDYSYNHDPCFYGVRKGKRSHWNGARNEPTVWNIEHKSSDSNHGAEKPVACMRRPIENNSSPGQAVYDPFIGSGTTIVAAEITGRSCHALEIEPAYCDVIVTRWQNFTGKQAGLEEDGRTFEQVKEDRVAVPA